jgi:hypothetical protein
MFVGMDLHKNYLQITVIYSATNLAPMTVEIDNDLIANSELLCNHSIFLMPIGEDVINLSPGMKNQIDDKFVKESISLSR